jgi:hypothetical protein
VLRRGGDTMSAAIRLPSRKEFALTAPAFLFGVRLWTSVCLALFIDAFNLAVTRATEICMGIVSAGLVLAGTDFGGARHRLATQRQALRMTCLAAAEALVAFPADTASQRLLSDWTAEAFLGLEYALNGQALLEVPRQSSPSPGRLHLRLPDLLPCFVSALRVFVTFAAIELSAGIIGPGNGIGLKTAEFHRLHPGLSPHWSDIVRAGLHQGQIFNL